MLTVNLRDYQEPGPDKFHARGNLLAAMETGTGKTIVATACAEDLLGSDCSRTLVVVPPSLKWQWARKLAEYTDLPTVQKKTRRGFITVPDPECGLVIDGTPKKRLTQYQSISSATEYVVIGYDNVIDDSRWVYGIEPDFTVLDEASMIKSFDSERSKSVKSMLMSEYRLALTATPIENRPEELYSIMQWVDPDFLGREDFFEKSYIRRDKYGNIRGYRNLDVLQRRMDDVMFRCTLEDPAVAKWMPRVSETNVYVDMDDATARAYEDMAGDLLHELQQLSPSRRFDLAAHYGHKPNEGTQIGKAMAVHMAIERMLDHPDLVIKSAIDYESSQRERKAGKTKKTWPGSKYSYNVWQSNCLDEVWHSAKLDEVVSTVCPLLTADTKTKVLIFTKYQDLISYLAEAFSKQGWKLVTYDGTMSALAKEGSIQEFTDDPECRIFISSHAGAYGQDLWMANWLINIDQPPSFGKKHQINGRHVRATGTWDEVHVVNVITRGTIEERNVERLAFKERTARAALDGRGAMGGRVDNTVKSLTRWLAETLGMA